MKTIKKSETIVIILVYLEVQHIVFVVYNLMFHKEIPVVFHNGSNYDYHFIIKKLANETDWKKY